MNSDSPDLIRSMQLMEEAEQTLRAIQYGTSDVMITGGTEAVTSMPA